LKKINNKYEHIISLGFFCNVALELESIGRRDASDPFDWVITDIITVNTLLKNNFQDLFHESLLSRNTMYPYIVEHEKYKFDFYHDFNQEDEIKKQVATVSEKYLKRIVRFFKRIQEPTLFIRYIENSEIDYWYNDAKELVSFIKGFNLKNSFILITNEDLTIDLSRIIPGVIKVFHVKKDENEIVSRRFIKENKPLLDYILSINYPLHRKINNYFKYYIKKCRNFTRRIH
jgi:hypothetical protein